MYYSDYIMLLLLCAGAAQDMRSHTIPLYETAPMFLLAIIKTVCCRTYAAALGGWLFTLILFLWIVIGRQRFRIGGADFRILAALSVSFGLGGLFVIILMSFLAIPATKLLMRNTIETGDGLMLNRALVEKRNVVPYAPPLFVGAALYALILSEI